METALATEVEDTICKEGADDLRRLIRSPKPAKSSWKFVIFEKIAQIQDGVRDELRSLVWVNRYAKSTYAALDEAQQESTNEVGCSTRKSCLRGGHYGPGHHLNWNPHIWTKLLGDKLGRQFGKQERAEEDCLSIVVLERSITLTKSSSYNLHH